MTFTESFLGAHWAKSFPCIFSLNGPWLIGSCWWLWLRMAFLKGKQGQEAVSQAFLYKCLLPFHYYFLLKNILFLKVLHVYLPRPTDLFYLLLPPAPAPNPRPLPLSLFSWFLTFQCGICVLNELLPVLLTYAKSIKIILSMFTLSSWW